MDKSEQMNKQHLRTKATSKGKESRALAILAAYHSHSSHLSGYLAYSEDHQGLVTWFQGLSNELSPASYLRKRQWLSSYLRDIGEKSLADKIKTCKPKTIQSSKADLKPSKGKSKDKVKSKGWIDNEKGLQVSGIDGFELRRFIEFSLSRQKGSDLPRYRDGSILAVLFQLTCMTGIRPAEWDSVSISEKLIGRDGQDYGMVLSVVTSEKGGDKTKSKEERLRHLRIGHWTDRERNMVRLFVSNLPWSREDGSYEKIIAGLQQTMIKINKQLFGVSNRITLYSARHLYASEFRRGKLGNRFSLAAAMGHSDIINQRYYGDHGDDGDRISQWSLALPIETEVREVWWTAKRRNDKTIARIAERFGKEGRSTILSPDTSW